MKRSGLPVGLTVWAWFECARGWLPANIVEGASFAAATIVNHDAGSAEAKIGIVGNRRREKGDGVHCFLVRLDLSERDAAVDADMEDGEWFSRQIFEGILCARHLEGTRCRSFRRQRHLDSHPLENVNRDGALLNHLTGRWRPRTFSRNHAGDTVAVITRPLAQSRPHS